MKTMLRDLDTGLLYCWRGKCVESRLEATNFGDAEATEKHAAQLDNSDLEVFVVDDKEIEKRRTR